MYEFTLVLSISCVLVAVPVQGLHSTDRALEKAYELCQVGLGVSPEWTLTLRAFFAFVGDNRPNRFAVNHYFSTAGYSRPEQNAITEVMFKGLVKAICKARECNVKKFINRKKKNLQFYLKLQNPV